ncbi:ATP-binding cassette domain-containing protein [Nonomuraea sp. NPDC026600]|uniref:ATP-binding cassette domain-containing protein n=1 Tax=Nonomuraea sp. NPDC026600 TaxID=3155363 RepID=UPI003403B702
MPVIEVNGDVKRYRDVTAVDDVSLQVQPGQIYALLSPNSAGKTTLIGMIAPTSGSHGRADRASSKGAIDCPEYRSSGPHGADGQYDLPHVCRTTASKRRTAVWTRPRQ